MISLPDTLPPRRDDWRERLHAYVVDRMRAPFRPGRHDCALFAAGAVEAMTGLDPAAGWRGRYRTLAEGRAALLAAGFDDHVAAVASLLDEVPPALAQVGDLAVCPGAPRDAALGVVMGAGIYVLQPSGMAIADRLCAERAYRV